MKRGELYTRIEAVSCLPRVDSILVFVYFVLFSVARQLISLLLGSMSPTIGCMAQISELCNYSAYQMNLIDGRFSSYLVQIKSNILIHIL